VGIALSSLSFALFQMKLVPSESQIENLGIEVGFMRFHARVVELFNDW